MITYIGLVIVSILLLTLPFTGYNYLYMSSVSQGVLSSTDMTINILVNNGMGVISQLDGWKHSFLGVKAGASNVFEDSVLVYRTGFVIFIFFAFLCEKLLTVSSSG